MRGNATLIAGPTASGKSALALSIARERNGVIVNADSMQVYDLLRVLTARPSVEEMGGVPHLLFGHVHPSEHYSVGRWSADVVKLLSNPLLCGKHLVFVGGTGLYFKSLLGGLSQMPLIPEAVRTLWRDKLQMVGSEELHGELEKRDPQTAARLRPQDGQRIVRAIEVFEASGRPISDWQGKGGDQLLGGSQVRKICLVPDRQVLRERIDRRFQEMIGAGAVDEVRSLLALGLDPALPCMRAIGVPDIAAHLRGETDLATATERASAATRQYAKRQTTWLRHQLGADWEFHK